MLVKMLVSRSGAGGASNAGDEIEVDTAEAERMIAAGQAVPVRKARKGKPEKAVKDV
jgi:hypothetical protein